MAHNGYYHWLQWLYTVNSCCIAVLHVTVLSININIATTTTNRNHGDGIECRIVEDAGTKNTFTREMESRPTILVINTVTRTSNQRAYKAAQPYKLFASNSKFGLG